MSLVFFIRNELRNNARKPRLSDLMKIVPFLPNEWKNKYLNMVRADQRFYRKSSQEIFIKAMRWYYL